MLSFGSMHRALSARRARAWRALQTAPSAPLSVHQLLVLLSHTLHARPCPRHQHTLSSSPTSSLPSSQPAASSTRLHSSLAARPAASDHSPASAPASASASTSTSLPSASFVSLLDGAPLPSSASAVRALLDRLRPLLYLELSRLSQHSAPHTETGTTHSAQPTVSSSDWLSAVDVDAICSLVLQRLGAERRSASSREVVRLTVAAIRQQIAATDEVTRLAESTHDGGADGSGAAGSSQLRGRERRIDNRQPKFILDRLRQQWDGSADRLVTGQRTSQRQPDIRRQQHRGMQAIDQAEVKAAAADSATSDRRILTVPLHRHHTAIFTTSPSTVLQPGTATPSTSAASASPSPASSVRVSSRCPSTLFQLYNEQLQLETLALNEAVADYAEVTKTLVGLHKGAQLRPAHKMMLGWYGPLVAAIEKEQERARQRTAPGASSVRLTAVEAHLPYMLHLPAPQLAVLTMHSMLSMALARDHKSSVDGVRFVIASQQVGQAVNLEAKMQGMRRDKQKMRQFLSSVVNSDSGSSGQSGGTATAAGSGSEALASPNVLSKLRTSRRNAWSDEMCVKLGAALLQLLVSTAAVPDTPKSSFAPAFTHQTVWEHSAGAKHHVGVILADERVLNVVLRDHEATEAMMPKLKPMIVTPRPWKSHDDGGYLSVASRVMRSHGSHMQQEAVSRADLTQVYRGLNYLSSIPWRINSRVLDVVERIWAAGGGVADLPSQTNVPLPAEPLAATEATAASTSRRAMQKAYSVAVRANRNLHSQRCDVNLKLSVARQFNRRTIYFPFNVDFRGRAYPIPPHLNHIGNDLCRGLLLFDQKKRLGERGLRWLKVHTTNLWGHGMEKRPYEQRVQWCDEHADRIRHTATNPLPSTGSGGPQLSSDSAWWLGAEKPFEFLASCFELHAALSSPSPVDFLSCLPVHQDGSCNGLQHYAALGRDVEGGMAVNLTPSDRPQDVYTVVCNRVLQRVREDAQQGQALAKALDGKVTRKIVKQTVMTSVYGVTLIGARDQIAARLKEASDIRWPNPVERSIEAAALYLAKTTLSSLYSAFSGARLIQDWLSLCANAMSSVQQPVSWLTPLGLPVIQPYRRSQSYSVQTCMQAVSLADHSDLLPVSSQRQRSAFPPNFIHSLDATHMLMTGVRPPQPGLGFTAVHHGCWTLAGDMDAMSGMLREEFVRLYEQPILENVRSEWEKRFPELDFEPVPARGELDLKLIKDSAYFFN